MMRATLFSLLFLVALQSQTQSWVLSHVIDVPGCDWTGSPWWMTQCGWDIALRNDSLVVAGGWADSDSAPIVSLHGRHQGGLGQWDMLHQFDPPPGKSAGFGRRLKMGSKGIFVGGDKGTWRHVAIGPSQWLVQELDTAHCRSLAVNGDDLLIASPLINGSRSALVKLFRHAGNGIGFFEALAEVSFLISPTYVLYLSDGWPGSDMAAFNGDFVVTDPLYGVHHVSHSICKGRIHIMNYFENELNVNYVSDIHDNYPHLCKYGKSIYMKKDTLFVGFEVNGMDDSGIHVYTRPATNPMEWALTNSIPPPPVGDTVAGILGASLAGTGSDVFIGCSTGLAFYSENLEGGWDFLRLDTLGGPATRIEVDGDIMAALVPSVGKVYVYERITTGVSEAFLSPVGLKAWPIPALDHVRIAPLEVPLTEGKLLVCDVLGRERSRMPWDGRSELVLYRSASTGVELLRVVDGNGKIQATGRVLWSGHSR